MVYKTAQTAQESFITRLYRQKNKSGFIKAFSGSPIAFNSETLWMRFSNTIDIVSFDLSVLFEFPRILSRHLQSRKIPGLGQGKPHHALFGIIIKDWITFEKLSELRGGGFDKSSGTYLHGSWRWDLYLWFESYKWFTISLDSNWLLEKQCLGPNSGYRCQWQRQF